MKLIYKKLRYNKLECAYVCPDCGAIFGDDEIARVFGFGPKTRENFEPSYCMDCGTHWDDVLIEEDS